MSGNSTSKAKIAAVAVVSALAVGGLGVAGFMLMNDSDDHEVVEIKNDANIDDSDVDDEDIRVNGYKDPAVAEAADELDGVTVLEQDDVQEPVESEQSSAAKASFEEAFNALKSVPMTDQMTDEMQSVMVNKFYGDQNHVAANLLNFTWEHPDASVTSFYTYSGYDSDYIKFTAKITSSDGSDADVDGWYDPMIKQFKMSHISM